jgi:GT2 family glycosyltransferase
VDKVAIVILNYLNYQDTIECVESLTIDQYPEKEIIIVDNGSTNESREQLEKKFKGSVHLVFSDQNEGFARGNNLGICYATENLGCSFVLLVNNDTLFKDPHMITTLMNAYEPGVGVLGPRISGADGHEQNPLYYNVIRSKLKQDWHYRRKIAKVQFKRTRFYQTIRKINVFRKKKKIRIKRNDLAFKSHISLNMVLQGSCLLLTKDYFQYYPELFPDTFLYFEEEILTILTYKVGLAKKFVHTTYIFHKEHLSTGMSFNNLKSIRTGYFLQSLKMAREIYPLDYKVLVNKYFDRYADNFAPAKQRYSTLERDNNEFINN